QVSLHEFLIGFREIDYSFNDSNHAGNHAEDAASEHGREQHDDAFSRVAKHKLVNTKSAKNDSQHPSQNFLVSAQRLPIGHCSRLSLVNRLHRLITADGRQSRLAIHAELRRVIVYSAALGAISTHYLLRTTT